MSRLFSILCKEYASIAATGLFLSVMIMLIILDAKIHLAFPLLVYFTSAKALIVEILSLYLIRY